MSNSVPLTDIPKDWVIGELKEFLSFISYGFTNPMPESVVGPYMVTAKDVTGLKIQYGSARKTTSDAFENVLSNKSRPQKNDLLLTKDGTLGRVAIVDKEGICINQSVAVLRVNEKLSSMFLLQLLASPVYQRVMLDNAGGSAIKHIYITTVDKMKVAIPCDREQQKIAAILTSVDEVIEKTQAQIDKLKDLKTGMMQQLLTSGVGVDGKPHAEFKDSAVGRVPKGWEAVSTGSIAKSIVPGRNKPKSFSGDIPWLTIADLDDMYVGKSHIGRGVTRQVLSEAKGKTLPKDTVIMSVVGEFGVSSVALEEVVINQQLHGFVCSKVVDPVFLCLSLQYQKSQMETLATQTTIAYMNKNNAESVFIALPPLTEQRKIVSIIMSIDEKLNLENKALIAKTELKKGLMQDLLTGKVRVTVLESSTGH